EKHSVGHRESPPSRSWTPRTASPRFLSSPRRGQNPTPRSSQLPRSRNPRRRRGHGEGAPLLPAPGGLQPLHTGPPPPPYPRPRRLPATCLRASPPLHLLRRQPPALHVLRHTRSVQLHAAHLHRAHRRLQRLLRRDEPPLLEELGINTRQIWRKTLSILHPLRSADPSLHADADLSGPFLFLLSFGLFQLLAGKFHFGIVLGWVTVASLFLYFVFSMLSGGRRGDLDLYRCVSLVGYCMLPMVIFSAVSLFLPRGGGLIFGMGMGFVLWSTRVCTRLLAELASSGDEHRGLIAYACWLVYMLFSLLVIF
uniref:Protein YIP n=2 Tax=Aegilops tauschii subsp. strangulata TaxID=200361 RepID=A0A453IBC3_AEGTS